MSRLFDYIQKRRRGIPINIGNNLDDNIEEHGERATYVDKDIINNVNPKKVKGKAITGVLLTYLGLVTLPIPGILLAGTGIALSGIAARNIIYNRKIRRMKQQEREDRKNPKTKEEKEQEKEARKKRKRTANIIKKALKIGAIFAGITFVLSATGAFALGIPPAASLFTYGVFGGGLSALVCKDDIRKFLANRKAIKNTKRAEIDVEKQPSIDKDILKNEKTSENKQDFTKEKETKTAEVTPSVAVKDEPLINNELNSVSPQPPKASASMPADVATDTVINNYKNPVPSGIKPEKVSYPSPLANMNEEKFHKMIASALLVATQYGDKRHKTR